MPFTATSPRRAFSGAGQTQGLPTPALTDALVLLAVVLCCAWKFSLPLRSHLPLLGFAQDDFYYYLKAAQNLAGGHGSTFDGTTLTNGYHPLYFLFWTCASFFVHSLRAVFQLLWLLDTASATAIFLLARQTLRRVASDALLTNALALAVLLPCIATISYQMEVTLAMPLGIAFLATGLVPPRQYTVRRCALLGLLGAFTMLARLDASILVFLFLLGMFAVRDMRAVLTPRNMASFSLASLPLICVYFGLNRHYFHEWLPISGAAKQLRRGWLPDLSLLHLSFAGFSLVFLAITLVSVVAAALLWPRLRPQEKVVCSAALWMPLAFYALETFLSDWKLWGWYLYALRFSLLATAILVLVAVRESATAKAHPLRTLAQSVWAGPLLLLAAVIALAATNYKIDPEMMSIAAEDTQLNQFQKTHPGRYAMGDRAGMFGYLSSSPVLQAEGLMMDRGYLQHIRQEDDLLTTLRQYQVNYYVQYVFHEDAQDRIHGTCLSAQEPSNVGKAALRMRSAICDTPVAIFPSRGGETFVYLLAGRQ